MKGKDNQEQQPTHTASTNKPPAPHSTTGVLAHPSTQLSTEELVVRRSKEGVRMVKGWYEEDVRSTN